MSVHLGEGCRVWVQVYVGEGCTLWVCVLVKGVECMAYIGEGRRACL